MKYLIAATVLVWFYIGIISAIQKPATVCEKETCKAAAEYLLNSIDQTQNPCKDFYQFSCGGFINENPLPNYETEYGTDDVLFDNALELIQKILERENSSSTTTVQNAQSLYNICLKQEDNVSLLNAEIQKLGGYPIVSQKSNNNSIEFLLASLALRGTDAIFSSAVGVDLKNSNQYIIEADYGDLPDALDFGNNNVYTDAIKTAAIILGAPKSKNITDEANEIVQFGVQLANFIPNQAVIPNFTEVYQKLTINELQQLTDPSEQVFNWLAYYGTLLNTELTSSEPVAVYNIEYIVQAVQLIKSTNKDTVVNYAFGLFINEYAFHTGGALLKEINSIIEDLTGETAAEPRNTTCTAFVNEVFGYALAKQYVAESFPATNIRQIEQIFQIMQNAFEFGTSETIYYDNKTLHYSQQKIAAMQVLIGYPDFIKNDQAVNTYYKDFPTMTSNPFTNAINSISSLVKQNLKSLHTTVDKKFFDLVPSTVLGEYDESNNIVTLPAALLHQPYYTSGQLLALDIGALGSYMGTLINKGINNIGSQFDINGNLNGWWPEAVLNAVDDTLQCLSNQFDAYCPSNKSECILGPLEIRDELDYLYGILGAYQAYQNWVTNNTQEQQLPGLEKYTSNQLLFISFAQRFCSATVPANVVAKTGSNSQLFFRNTVVGTLSNLKEFSEAFNCPAGPMNRGNDSCVQI